MKVKIARHDLITLLPENDADYALLNLWAGMNVYFASSAYGDKKTQSVSIGFSSESLAVVEGFNNFPVNMTVTDR